MSSSLIAVVVDARDAPGLARFWAAALAAQQIETWDDGAGTRYVEIRDSSPVLLFQPVPEGKQGKNRVHLDVAPREGTQDEEVRRLTELGATVLDPADRFPWVVMADPEGNEFCVLPPRSD